MSSKTKTTATKEEASPALVPKLRFPEFRGAEEWVIQKLSTSVQLVSGMHLSPEQYATEGAVPYFTGPSDFTNSVEAITKRTSDSASLAKRDDTLITVKGSGVGEIWYLTLPSVAMGRQLMAVRALDASSRFVFQFLLTKRVRFEDLAAGNLIPGLARGDILNLEAPFPLLPEQQKIAECLSSVDELIAAQARKLEALKTHKQGLMQQLFPREGETQPRLRFPEFQNAGEWEESPLSKFILSLDAGVSVNSGDRPANKTEFGVLKTSAVTNGVFESEENKVVFAESELSRLKEPVCGGTIIISRMNTPALVGANAYVESSHENLFLPDRLWAAKPREGVSMRFLAFILSSDKGRAALSKLGKGSSGSMKNITKPDVLAFSVMAPSPEEQQRIASCLTSLDDLIAAQTRKHEALKTHKKALMQQLFPSPEEVEA